MQLGNNIMQWEGAGVQSGMSCMESVWEGALQLLVSENLSSGFAIEKRVVITVTVGDAAFTS